MSDGVGRVFVLLESSSHYIAHSFYPTKLFLPTSPLGPAISSFTSPPHTIPSLFPHPRSSNTKKPNVNHAHLHIYLFQHLWWAYCIVQHVSLPSCFYQVIGEGVVRFYRSKPNEKKCIVYPTTKFACVSALLSATWRVICESR